VPDPKYSEVSLERAYDFLLDMDTIYGRSDKKDVVAKAFREEVLTKYNVDVLPKLVELLFKAGAPQKLICAQSKDKHRLMSLCYNLRKVGKSDA